MKKTSLLLLFGLLILRGPIFAQNPYESLGKVAPVLTLSEGKYQEFFTNDTIVRIGTVLLNTQTQEIVGFVAADDTIGFAAADVASRFLSVDPIGRQYPELTPYQFASNRPIDGIDLDGLEFSKSTYLDGKGVTQMKITLKVQSNNMSNLLTPEQAKDIFDKTQAQFSTSIGDVYDKKRNRQYQGELIYDKNATISYNLFDDALSENITAGLSIPGQSGIEVSKFKDGKLNLRDIEDAPSSGVHELIHQGGVDHPTDEENTAEDVGLLKIDPMRVNSDSKVVKNNSFESKKLTIIPDIYFNVMIYGFKVVDGKRVNDVRGNDRNGTKLSPDQLNIIIENIDKGKVNGEAMQKD